MSNSCIELRGVRKHYGRRQVLTVDDLVLQRGERVMICGPNGCGKSTLLRILIGISRADEGRVSRPSPAPRIGFVPQSGGLYPELSIRDNIRVRQRLFGLGDIDLHSSWCIEQLGLAELLDRPVAELSGGLQRLAAIAAAVDTGPTMLMIDEPLNGVDVHRSEVLIEGINRLAARLDLLILTSPIVTPGWSLSRELGMENGSVSHDRNL